MAMNRVQFQAGLSMPEFLELYGTEAKCQAALEAARWPDGFKCPACLGPARTTFLRNGLRYWQCAHCAQQCSLISGTVFEATKLPLTRWFLAMQLLTQSKNNVSALELKRQLGCPTAAPGCSSTRSWRQCAGAKSAANSMGAWSSTIPIWAGGVPAARVAVARRTRCLSWQRCRPVPKAIRSRRAWSHALSHTKHSRFCCAAHRANRARPQRRAVVLSVHHDRWRRARAHRHRQQGRGQISTAQGGQHAACEPEDLHTRDLSCL